MSATERPEQSWLPDPHLLRIEESKVTEYLLSSSHPKGKGKAKFFFGLGFSIDQVEEFIAALRQHAADNAILEIVHHDYGTKTTIECFMPTPSGQSSCIRSVWNDHGDGSQPKLVTAFPAKRQGGTTIVRQ
jgi:hypothetical protein